MTSDQQPGRQICLAIDTALNACSLALAICPEEGTEPVLIEKSILMDRGHAEALMTQLEALMQEAEVDYSDLTCLAVTVGPGSFTGLRVGLATARAFALALKIPLVGLSTLQALEVTARELGQDGVICAAIDARRGQIYCQIFGLDHESKPKAASLEEVMQDLSSMKDVSLIGSASELIRQVQDEPQNNEAGEPSLLPQVPDMAVVAKWALKQPKTDISPSPLYLRAPDAKPQVGKAIARA
ncbi:tRNA (adenosine(37)-N6)-threonylcarbamoyltransferase complex dimerization subunit type 1 TsaB [Cohaesibacter gelatinilyticus]|uniref:N(6)-L-threonylcarbamoyladenine synthase n=1 Tax=Cohaesibacter gelatinilyticus TaxID=372072 RepID=A0A285PFG0_9HYPH|nr:tRNA (adenosine(37)-N6)-threonylcarbamoyltransferase complex dimerization subunit type 1 TsaB [Cohaesibacter gelatinilyticus]SNZ19967.1 tRNA threonylcarbamoyladenosine biosynthesis protein TsaB [Cohaesibacter gelatinilyticus]